MGESAVCSSHDAESPGPCPHTSTGAAAGEFFHQGKLASSSPEFEAATVQRQSLGESML